MNAQTKHFINEINSRSDRIINSVMKVVKWDDEKYSRSYFMAFLELIDFCVRVKQPFYEIISKMIQDNSKILFDSIIENKDYTDRLSIKDAFDYLRRCRELGKYVVSHYVGYSPESREQLLELLNDDIEVDKLQGSFEAFQRLILNENDTEFLQALYTHKKLQTLAENPPFINDCDFLDNNLKIWLAIEGIFSLNEAYLIHEKDIGIDNLFLVKRKHRKHGNVIDEASSSDNDLDIKRPLFSGWDGLLYDSISNNNQLLLKKLEIDDKVLVNNAIQFIKSILFAGFLNERKSVLPNQIKSKTMELYLRRLGLLNHTLITENGRDYIILDKSSQEIFDYVFTCFNSGLDDAEWDELCDEVKVGFSDLKHIAHYILFTCNNIVDVYVHLRNVLSDEEKELVWILLRQYRYTKFFLDKAEGITKVYDNQLVNEIDDQAVRENSIYPTSLSSRKYIKKQTNIHFFCKALYYLMNPMALDEAETKEETEFLSNVKAILFNQGTRKKMKWPKNCKGYLYVTIQYLCGEIKEDVKPYLEKYIDVGGYPNGPLSKSIDPKLKDNYLRMIFDKIISMGKQEISKEELDDWINNEDNNENYKNTKKEMFKYDSSKKVYKVRD